jgi:UDP-3-O-[3-hydroxymyristoyl] glucosamine N-acyltransferase
MISNTKNKSISLNVLLDKDSQTQIKKVGEPVLNDFIGISPAHIPQEKCLVFIKDIQYLKKLQSNLGSVSNSDVLIVTTPKWESEIDSYLRQGSNSYQFIVSENIDKTMGLFSKEFHSLLWNNINSMVDGRQLGSVDIHPSAMISQNVFIGEHVSIGENVKIYPGCVVLPHVRIEDNTILFPNVSIYPYTKIGQSCRIHAQTTIGADGFGYFFQEGKHQKIWQFGGVEIGNEVEIGANSCIDSGTFTPTIIKDGCKLDNLVQIAHNSYLSEHVVMCGQAGTAGSSKIGPYSFFGGQTALSPHCEVGPQTRVAGAAKVTKNFLEGKIDLGGHPARPLKEWLRSIAQLRIISSRGNKK